MGWVQLTALSRGMKERLRTSGVKVTGWGFHTCLHEVIVQACAMLLGCCGSISPNGTAQATFEDNDVDGELDRERDCRKRTVTVPSAWRPVMRAASQTSLHRWDATRRPAEGPSSSTAVAAALKPPRLLLGLPPRLLLLSLLPSTTPSAPVFS